MISVCMATYNGEKYIRRQLESILSQLAEDDEVVISDDGSWDRTLEIVASFGDKRIRVLNHRPCGVAFNFENAIKEAKGEYIFLSDQDDIWCPGKVSKCRAALESGAELVLHNAEVTDGEGQPIMSETFFDLKHSAPGFWRNWSRNAFIGCCMAFHVSVVPRVTPFPQHINLHDEWIGLYMSYVGAEMTFLREPLIKYCQHEGNVSNCVYASKNSLWWKFCKRITFLWYCVIR